MGDELQKIFAEYHAQKEQEYKAKNHYLYVEYSNGQKVFWTSYDKPEDQDFGDRLVRAVSITSAEGRIYDNIIHNYSLLEDVVNDKTPEGWSKSMIAAALNEIENKEVVIM